jgi:hypothetical protein
MESMTMVKVVEKRIKHGKNHQATLKRGKNSSGTWITLKIINADSPTLSSDLTYAFANNVMSARRSNDSAAYDMGYSNVDALLSSHLIDSSGRKLIKKKKKAKTKPTSKT